MCGINIFKSSKPSDTGPIQPMSEEDKRFWSLFHQRHGDRR